MKVISLKAAFLKKMGSYQLILIKNKGKNNNNDNFIYLKKSEDDIPFLEKLQIVDSDLEMLNEWNFNVLEIHFKANKLNLIWQIFHSLNFLEKYEIESSIFINFLDALHEKYNQKNNPFHNFDHAFTGYFLYYYF